MSVKVTVTFTCLLCKEEHELKDAYADWIHRHSEGPIDGWFVAHRGEEVFAFCSDHAAPVQEYEKAVEKWETEAREAGVLAQKIFREANPLPEINWPDEVNDEQI